MAIQDIKVPDIGNYKNVPVIEILVKVGDTLKKEQSLLTLETDKATMEVPSPTEGVVTAIKVNVGDKISQGDLIIQVEAQDLEAKPSTTTIEAPKAPAAASPQELRVPDIGNYKNVPVIEILVKSGDVIKKEQSLFTLETDKATMEVPSTLAGKLTDIKIKVGDKVSQGDVIATIMSDASATSTATTATNNQKTSTPAAPAAPAPQAAPPSTQPFISYAYVHAGPAVRQFARELGADLTKIGGTGFKNRVTRDDVVRFIKAELSKAAQGGGGSGLNLLPDPQIDFAEFGSITTQKLPRIKKISGANLYRNWVRIPHITLFDEADITDLETMRKSKKAETEKMGIKLTPLPFLIKAVAGALKEYPLVNSSLSNDGENLILKEYIHIGVAVDTPNGLYVPVIRNADQKGILDIAKELGELSQKAKEGKIKPDEMKGGTFTISSLGSLGTTGFTPIVNMPEVGILGISKADMKPKWDGNTFVPRLMLPLSLSLDHRVVDGAEGGRFLSFLTKALNDLSELLL